LAGVYPIKSGFDYLFFDFLAAVFFLGLALDLQHPQHGIKLMINDK